MSGWMGPHARASPRMRACGRRSKGVDAGSAKTGPAPIGPPALDPGLLRRTGDLRRPPGIPLLLQRGRLTKAGWLPLVASMRSPGVPAMWFNPGEHWWPPPRVVHPWEANAEWRVHTCGRCKQERASLVATRPIRQGDELRAVTGCPGQVYLPDEAARGGH